MWPESSKAASSAIWAGIEAPAGLPEAALSLVSASTTRLISRCTFSG